MIWKRKKTEGREERKREEDDGGEYSQEHLKDSGLPGPPLQNEVSE